MNKLVIIFIFSFIAVGCNNKLKENIAVPETEEIAMNYQSFGDKINAEMVLSQAEMSDKFKAIQPGDTVAVKFTTGVKEVCQSKGCWMRLDMGEEEAMVKFKDYGFFMPKDIAGKDVIVEGKAFVEEMSVEDQRHYAEDAGKSKEEIEAITAPKRTLSVVSNGVLIPEN